MAAPHAIRVRTADGWQDLALTGPQGPPGADGADGRVYDSDQIGVVKTWTGKTVPINWALANGQRFTQADYPQGYDFAKQEADALNPLWTYRTTPDISFTVPNLSDRFLLASGARAFGVRSQTDPTLANPGEETHVLTPAETAMKSHSHGGTTGTDSPDHAHSNTHGAFLEVSGTVSTWLDTTNTAAYAVYHAPTTAGATVRHAHSITAETASNGAAHNNMPPYVVIAQIVKIKGAQIDSDGDLVGPPGPPGAASTVPGPQGPPGQGVPIGGTAAQVLRKKTVTDYDTEWANPTGGSGLPEIYIGPDPPTPRDAQVIWVDTDESAPASLNVGMDVWHYVGTSGEPVLQSGWVAVDAPKFRKYPDGNVRISGMVRSGSAPTVFTLPVGYRPAQSQRIATTSNNGGTTVLCELIVNTDGTIGVYGSAATTFVSLYIDFDTETVQQVASVAAQPLDTIHVVGAAGEPAYQGTWTVGGQPVRFRKDPVGRVWVNGSVNGGTADTTMFFLPAGYRPARDYYFDMLATAGGSGGYVLVRASDGAVVPHVTGGYHDFSFDTEALTTYSTGAIIPSAQSMPVTMDVWHTVGAAGEPAFQNSWVNYDTTTFAAAGFRRGPDGRVSLRGLVKTGVINTVVFTLPVGCRPPKTVSYSAQITGGTAQLSVQADGSVFVGTVNNGTLSFVYLDVVEFDTESTLVTASIAVQPIEPWHAVGAVGEPAFQNSWTNVGVGPSQMGFRKFPDGRVRLRGTVKGGGDYTTIFTLPAGYRPPATVLFPMPTADGASTTWVQINASGTIQMGDVGSTAQATYLDGVEFDTESVSNYATAVVQGITPVIVPAVSVLPSIPVDGQECYYRFIPSQTPATTIPLLWHLRWDAATSAWLPVGDQRPVKAIYYPGATTSMGSGAWGTYDANDPRLSVPLNGTYECETGYGECYGGGSTMNCGFGKNGTPVAEAGSYIAGSGAGTAQCIADPQVLLTTDAIRQFYWLSAAGAQNIVFRGRYIQIRPMRITP